MTLPRAYLPGADYLCDGYIYHSELPKTQVFSACKSIQRFWGNIGGYDGVSMVFPDYIHTPQIAYFVRSGRFTITHSAGVLRLAGEEGRVWSKRAYSAATQARNLAIHAEYFNLGAVDDRWYAFPLRCLSTVLGM